MWITLAIVAAVVLAALVYLATLDGSFRVRRSREIDAPAAAVFDAVLDFKSWPAWSPWLMHEPDARLDNSDDYRQEGGSHGWDGRVVGAGRLTHVGISPPRRIEQRIEFTRPFKSVGRVGWEFEEHGDTTLVSWEMSGRMPFLFRFMASRMEPAISRDYDLGLALLNGYLAPAAPHPSLDFAGAQELEDFSYWAIPFSGNLRQLEKARPEAIARLAAAAGNSGLPLTLYRRFDPLATQYMAEIAIPVGERPPESNYSRREFAGGRYFRLTLKGDHAFLPLAWYALASHCSMHRIKTDRSRPALEIYHDDPAESADGNRVTTALYLPIR